MCEGPECGRPVFRGELCQQHDRQRRAGKRLEPLRKALSRADQVPPLEQLREAALSYADAGDDETAYRRSEDNLRKAAERYSQRAQRDAIRAGMEIAKARGLHIGRPRAASKSDREIADVAAVLGIRRAASALGISKDAVRRAIARCGDNYAGRLAK